MSNHVLTHYYNKHLAPFHNIVCQTEKTSDVINLLSNCDGKAYARFRNFDWYISQRRDTEQWLIQEFTAKGGIPKTLYPIYFILGSSDYIHSCYGNDVATYQIMLDEISEFEISFTLTDSMKSFLSEEHKQVFTKKDLLIYIEKQNLSVSDFTAMLDLQHEYVEAQIWSDSYIPNGNSH